MKLVSPILVLLCCLYDAAHASVGSSDDTSVSSETFGPSTDSTVLPETANHMALGDRRISWSFARELTLETVSLGIILTAFGTSIGCSIPGLLAGALLLACGLYMAKVELIAPRTRLIRKSARAAAGPVRLTPTVQKAFSAVNMVADLFRVITLLGAICKWPYCDAASGTLAVSLSRTLVATVLIGFVQLGLSLANRAAWMRDLEDSLQAAPRPE